MGDIAIQLEGLTKRFGERTAVDDVSLSIPTGTVYGLVGPNGAGKTTLMRTMLGFTPASSGSATVLGHRMPAGRGEVYPRLGVIIEEPRFYPFLSGRENLEQVVAARSDHLGVDAIDQVLETVGLTDRAGDRTKTYSLGMRQRLGIARAMLHGPELLVLDEPSNGLDPPGIRDMRVLLRRLAEEGSTVFVSSHLLAEIELMCDHVAVLQDGKVIADGSVAALADAASDQPATAARVLLGVPDVPQAIAALEGIDGVSAVEPGEHAGTVSLTVTAETDDLAAKQAAVARVNTELVARGVPVHLLQPAPRRSLEQRFLEMIAGSNPAPKGDAR
jgi:ABC-2 type transport system ATP-binding protein